MKYFASIIGLGLWLLFTFLLSLTILGIAIVMCIDEYWEIPSKLLNVFNNER